MAIRSTGGDFRQLKPAEAEAMQEDMLAGERWSAGQRTALHRYTTGEYMGINEAMRKSRRSREYDTTIAQIRTAMRPTTRDMIVHRSVHKEAFGFKAVAGALTPEEARQLVGKIFHDKAFHSTSVEPLKDRDVVHLEIHVPAGTRAAYLESLTSEANELEWLLDAGTHFKIEETRRGRNGKPTLRLTVVGQDEQSF